LEQDYLPAYTSSAPDKQRICV